jgi:4-hydroxy 2-oxovalerate aldolase
MAAAARTGKKIGVHAHNNQQLAFANTIEAASNGASYLDATMSGMGRGAGNCYMESLLSFLRNPKYNIVPVLKFVEKHMNPLKEGKDKWGFDVPYLMTGVFNSHPSSAIKFIKDGRTDYDQFYQEMMDMD